MEYNIKMHVQNIVLSQLFYEINIITFNLRHCFREYLFEFYFIYLSISVFKVLII